MKNITIKEIIDLISTKVENQESKIDKLYEWYMQRNMEIIKWILTSSAAIFASFLISFFKNELQVNPILLVITPILCAASSSYAIYRIYKLKNIQKEYIKTLTLHAKLKPLSSFFSYYKKN
jgi:hypothetical protein